jgi:hypothetical protein
MTNREVRRRRGGQDTPRYPDQQDQNPMLSDDAKALYVHPQSPDRATCWQDIFQP